MMCPPNLVRSTLAFWTLIAEASVVITLRVLGMAGILPVHHTENRRMAAEKAPAFAAAMAVGTRAAMQGQSPERVALAAMRPLRHKTRANVRRLSKPRALGKYPKQPLDGIDPRALELSQHELQRDAASKGEMQ